eukprot:GEMP01052841.1.p1 GENE.GEMP01052841.1~~GEMP01052841.1.p1  ORF type:complete len:208 (+),score=50.80 GEMP01052841.1:33-656(+)
MADEELTYCLLLALKFAEEKKAKLGSCVERTEKLVEAVKEQRAENPDARGFPLKAWQCLEADVERFCAKKHGARDRFRAELKSHALGPSRTQKALQVVCAMQSRHTCKPIGHVPSDPEEACIRLFPAYGVCTWLDQLQEAKAEFAPELETITRLKGALPCLEPRRDDFIRLGLRAAEESEGAERLKWLRFVDFVANDRKALASFWKA